MKSLPEFIPFLNEQAAYHSRQVIRHRADLNKKRLHEGIAGTFVTLANVIQSVVPIQSPELPTSSPTALTPADLAGLPDELIKELHLSESDTHDIEVLNIINDAGGTMSLDKLLISLYRKTGRIHKRPKLTARLYRMVQKGVLFNVPKKKGLYTTAAPSVLHELAEELNLI